MPVHRRKKKIPVVGAFKVGSLFFLTEMVNEYLLRMVHGEKNDNSYSFQNLKLLIKNYIYTTLFEKE